MKDTYKDSPQEIHRWIGSLSEYEKEIFNKAYLIAVCGFAEQMVESKRKLIYHILDAKDEEKKDLLGRLQVLDVLENYYEKKASRLGKSFLQT